MSLKESQEIKQQNNEREFKTLQPPKIANFLQKSLNFSEIDISFES